MTMSLQEISDRMEIQDLMISYSYAIDSRNWDALDDVFTPDAHIDYSVFGGSVGNLAETKEFLAGAMPMFTTLQHMVSGTTLDFHGGDVPDSADAKTQCHNPMTMGDAEKPDLIFFTGDSLNEPEGLPVFKECLEKIAAIAPTFAIACAVCASGSLAVARRAASREFPDNREETAEAKLTAHETRGLL